MTYDDDPWWLRKGGGLSHSVTSFGRSYGLSGWIPDWQVGIRDGPDIVLMSTCEYCGRVYKQGTTESCKGCGAAPTR